MRVGEGYGSCSVCASVTCRQVTNCGMEYELETDDDLSPIKIVLFQLFSFEAFYCHR